MADKTSDDELDDEIAELEKEIAELEEEEGLSEEEPKKKGSFKDRLPFGGGSETEEAEAPEEPAEDAAGEDAQAAPETEEDEKDEDERGLSGLIPRFGSEDDEDEEDEEPQEEAPTPPPEDDLEPEPQPEPEPEPEPARAEPDETDPDELETDRERSRSDYWERTEDGGWRRLEDPKAAEPGEEEDEEDVAGAAALLARFRGGDEVEEDEEEDEPDAWAPPPPEEEEEEEEDDDKLIIAAWIGGIILLLLLIALAAWWLLGDAGGGDVTAAVTSDALQQDGRFVGVTGAPISFDASDTSGDVDEYRWAFGDDQSTTTTEPTVEHTYASSGTYTVTLTAVSGGTTSEATLEVLVVQAPEAKPRVLLDGEAVAAPGEVGNNVFVGQTVTLDGEDSTADPESSITSYAWDLDGDGEPDETGATATTSFDEAGRWTVDLTVTDDLGNTDTVSERVHVSEVVRFENETVGPAVGSPTTERHNVTIDMGRGGVPPVEMSAVLSYNASDAGGTGGVVGGQVEPDLDLNVTSPAGTVTQAEEDEGAGNESLTVSGADLAPLGEWSFAVKHDEQQGVTGAGSDVEYTLVVRVIY